VSEQEQASSETPEMSGSSVSGSNKASQTVWFCDWLREGIDKAAEILGPPASAAKHFREARLEILRGIRELIDHRIEHLAKDNSKGSRIVVE
jgi:hypothetical protein